MVLLICNTDIMVVYNLMLPAVMSRERILLKEKAQSSYQYKIKTCFCDIKKNYGRNRLILVLKINNDDIIRLVYLL